MGLAEEMAAKVKVKCTKPEPDDRVSLLGVVFEEDADGKWSCLLPADAKNYFKLLFPHYEFSDEFIPEEEKPEPVVGKVSAKIEDAEKK